MAELFKFLLLRGWSCLSQYIAKACEKIVLATKQLPYSKRPHVTTKDRNLNNGWIAFSLRWPYQVFLILISVLLFLTVEILRQVSNRQNGLIHYSHLEDLPPRVFFSYNYLPTIIAVIYSILWSFVDFDAKRMEPYIQIRSERSPATNLLLDYGFQSPFLVPIRSIKSKHYAMALISTIYLLVSLLMPASAGSLFNLQNVSLTYDETFQALGTTHEPHEFFEGDFTNKLRTILASNGTSLPAWTTLDYAVEPFQPLDNTTIERNDTWMAETTVTFAESSCPMFEVINFNVTHRCCIADSGMEALSSILYVTADLVLPNRQGKACRVSLFESFISQVNGSLVQNASSSSWMPKDANIPPTRTLTTIALTSYGQPEDRQILPTKFRDSTSYRSSYDSPYYKDIDASCPFDFRFVSLLSTTYDEGIAEELDGLNYSSIDVLPNSTSIEVAEEIESVLSRMITVQPPAVFACDANYFTALANVTVRGVHGEIIDVQASPQKQELTIEEFNKTRFEFILDYGMTVEDFKLVNLPLDENVSRNESGQAANATAFARNSSNLDQHAPGIWAISDMEQLDFICATLGTHFFGLSEFEESALKGNETGMIEYGVAMSKLYRVLFAGAFVDLLANGHPGEHFSGTRNQEYVAILISPYYSIFAEVLLLLASAILLATCWRYIRAKSVLQSDPDSVASQCSLIADVSVSLIPLKNFQLRLDSENTEGIQKELEGCHTCYNEVTRELILVRDKSCSRNYKLMTNCPNALDKADKLPFFITKLGLIFHLLSLLLIIAALLFLRFWTSQINGFNFQFDITSFRSQILWSFTPSLLATVIEAFCLSTHRDLCALESWVRLRKDSSLESSFRPISLRYSSRPPLLVLMLSIKRRHYLLALISFVCFTTSILNITMAGLFAQTFINVPHAQTASIPFRASQLPFDLGQDSYGVTSAWSMLYDQINAYNNPLPWTNQDYSFIPPPEPDLSAPYANLETTTYESTTVGIGASLECDEFPDNDTLHQEGLGVWVEESDEDNLIIRGRARYVPSSRPADYSEFAYESVFGVQKDKPSTILLGGAPVFRDRSGLYLPPIDSDLNDTFRNRGIETYLSDLVILHTNTLTQNVELYLCKPSLEVDTFDISHNFDGDVASAVKAISPLLPEIRNTIDATDLLESYTSHLLRESQWTIRRTALTLYDYPGLLISKLRSDINSITVPITVPEAANRVFSRTFATWFSMYRDYFLQQGNADGPSISVFTSTVNTRELRVVPSIPAFSISIALLCFYLAVYILVVSRRRHRYTGPRIPKSIGSIIPWVLHSRMLKDFKGLHYMSSKDRDEALSRLGNNYAFGRFRGEDGRVRLGIEYEERLMAQGAYGDF